MSDTNIPVGIMATINGVQMFGTATLTPLQVPTASSSAFIPGSVSTAALQVTPTLTIAPGVNVDLGSFRPLPGHPYNTPITANGIDASSAALMTESGAAHIQADSTIPYALVDSRKTPFQPITFTQYAGDSDNVLWPAVSGNAVEGNGVVSDGNDAHALVLDIATGWLYETWKYVPATATAPHSAANGAIFDALGNTVRPYGNTSADTGGLALFPWLLGYDEAQRGAINHAIRMTMNHTKTNGNSGIFVLPASHGGDNWGTNAVLGMRLRLHANFDVSSYSPINQNILNAMKTYGLVIADNGQTGFFQTTNDSRWNGDELAQLKAVHLSDFDVVDAGPHLDMTTIPKGSAPVVPSFTLAKNADGTATLSWQQTGASYVYIEGGNPERGNSANVPYKAGQVYTLVAVNAWGRTRATVS